MDRSMFLAFLLVFAILLLSVPQGFGRYLVESRSNLPAASSMPQVEVRANARHLSMQVMDYGDDDVHANNAHASKGGFPYNIPAATPSPQESPNDRD